MQPVSMGTSDHAIYRSLTFWSGMAVIAFICWAWRDSMQTRSSLGGHSIGIAQSWGSVELGYDPDLWKGRNFEIYRGNVESTAAFERMPLPFLVKGKGLPPFSDDEVTPPPPDHLETAREMYEWYFLYRSRGSWILHVPHWLILLALMVAWSVLLLWRARRRKQAARVGPEG